MSVAFVFPGQGSPPVGIGRALAGMFPERRASALGAGVESQP
jgi:malonyl CoA-acyl carrier protein transacylase